MSSSFLQSKFFKAILSLIVLVLTFVTLTAFAAWSGPSSSSDNRAPFLNLGPVTQTKTGRLNITTGGSVLGSAKFEVAGPAMLAGGVNAEGSGSQTSALVLGDVYVGYAGSPSTTPTTSSTTSYDLWGNVTVSNDIKAQNLAHGNAGALEQVCTTQSGWLIPCIPVAQVSGCTDVTADNYNAAATVDDGSCVYTTIVPGCTDTAANNYNASANQNDGSCVYPPAPSGSVIYNRTYNITPTYSSDLAMWQTDLGAEFWFDNDYNTGYYPKVNAANPTLQNKVPVSGSCPGCTNTQFVVPAGVTRINFTLAGSGGAGGGYADGSNNTSGGQTGTSGSAQRGVRGGGGGAASAARFENIPVTPGDVLNITIGNTGHETTTGAGQATSIAIPGYGTVSAPGGGSGAVANLSYCNAGGGYPAGGAAGGTVSKPSSLNQYLQNTFTRTGGQQGSKLVDNGSAACGFCTLGTSCPSAAAVNGGSIAGTPAGRGASGSLRGRPGISLSLTGSGGTTLNTPPDPSLSATPGFVIINW